MDTCLHTCVSVSGYEEGVPGHEPRPTPHTAAHPGGNATLQRLPPKRACRQHSPGDETQPRARMQPGFLSVLFLLLPPLCLPPRPAKNKAMSSSRRATPSPAGGRHLLRQLCWGPPHQMSGSLLVPSAHSRTRSPYFLPLSQGSRCSLIVPVCCLSPPT